MNALILHPSGIHDGVDFDEVERELIVPALERLQISGASFPMTEASDIRAELLEWLVTSDLVLVDLSVAAPNLFYGVGLAHALRDKRTVLIRAASAAQPFDLRVDPIFVYDGAAPGLSVQDLIALLLASRQSDQIDSPVYVLLRGLERPRAAAVPPDFLTEVEDAGRNRDLGHLRLLSQEARSFHWAAEGLKKIGEAQFRSSDLWAARDTFELVTHLKSEDIDANLKLAAIYQRLRLPRDSDEVLRGILKLPGSTGAACAKTYALMGDNAKAAWLESWRGRPEPQRREEALRCVSLLDAYDDYSRAFQEDLNAYDLGLNALALGTIIVNLVAEFPNAWVSLFDNDKKAGYRLSDIEHDLNAFTSAVALSLDGARRRTPDDVGVKLSTAEFNLYTSNRPQRVADSYARAILGTQSFWAEAALRQALILRDLSVLRDNAEAAIGELACAASRASQHLAPSGTSRALLFVGHAIDEPGRPVPRFPASKEPDAREAILRAVDEQTQHNRETFVGIAGGSSGGDILFHEACEAVCIPSVLCLAVPPADYLGICAMPTGSRWDIRFRGLLRRRRYQILSNSADLPPWLRRKPPYDLRGRDMRWRYHAAAAIGAVTVIALWDGKAGATADMLQMAREQGASFVVLDTERLFHA
jgi:hypothetical protein